MGDEYGWKQVHGDVFRPASHNLVFSALIGAGHQLTTVIFSVIVFAILGELYTEYVVQRLSHLKICISAVCFTENWPQCCLFYVLN